MIYESEKERKKREEQKWKKIGRDIAKKSIEHARKEAGLGGKRRERESEEVKLYN